jgi:hypothetical protein
MAFPMGQPDGCNIPPSKAEETLRLSRSTLVRSLLAVSAPLLMPVSGGLAAEAQLFQFEQQAKLHCPDDVVVWVNLPSRIYSFQGERWYGSTKRGSFVCRAEGDGAGYKPSHDPAKEGQPSPIKWEQGLSGG